MSKKEKNGISKHTDQKDREQKIEQRSAAIEPEQLDTMPGKENQMETKPIFDDDFPGMQRLLGKVALITGGDSGIGRAVAVAFAKEKAKVVIVYLSETKDANDTKSYIEGLGGEALLIKGDIGDKQFCQSAIEKTMSTFGQLDILVNNAGEQHPQDEITDITPQQLQQTFRTNIFGMFYMVQAALEHLEEGASIINTASITAYEGNKTLLDYAATKGAITSFTRSLAVNLVSTE